MEYPVIGIDQGKAGGIAVINASNATLYSMPDTIRDLYDLLKAVSFNPDNPNFKPTVYVEKVGFHRQGNSASSSVKFARHCGNVEAILLCLGLPVIELPPTRWQSKLGALPKDRLERKRKIKALMQQQYPRLKNITLNTADALAIANHGELYGRLN